MATMRAGGADPAAPGTRRREERGRGVGWGGESLCRGSTVGVADGRCLKASWVPRRAEGGKAGGGWRGAAGRGRGRGVPPQAGAAPAALEERDGTGAAAAPRRPLAASGGLAASVVARFPPEGSGFPHREDGGGGGGGKSSSS